MDRRPVGVAVVVLALAVVMVVPMLSGRRSIGTAVPIALPSPPAVGDCVIRLADVTADVVSVPPLLSVSALRFGSCRGFVAAEVVAFWPDRAELDAAPRSRRGGPCHLPLNEYAGLTPPQGPGGMSAGGPAELVSWRPTLSYRAFLIVPSALEQRAGRDWSACVVGPANGGWYRGSLHASDRDGPLPAGFGSCWVPDESGRLAGPRDCGRSHTAELLAVGWNGDRGLTSGGGASADVGSSCGRLAGRMMVTDDPTRNGELEMVAERMDRLTATWTGNPSSIGCFVVAAGSRQLNGSVVGLGDGPIPFVS